MASTFSELWLEIEGAAKSAVDAIGADIMFAENHIVPIIEASLIHALGELKDIAIAAALEMAKRSISGEEKFGTVVTTVLQHAEANALNIGIADAQMLAQQTYRALQKAVGAL